MNNKKKNSIEQLEFDLEIWFAITKIYFPVEIKNSIERSKAMHKQEIIDAYWDGGQDVPMHVNTCKRYYNEKFGGQDNE